MAGAGVGDAVASEMFQVLIGLTQSKHTRVYKSQLPEWVSWLFVVRKIHISSW